MNDELDCRTKEEVIAETLRLVQSLTAEQQAELWEDLVQKGLIKTEQP